MKKRHTGLRSEIVIQLTLLMASAILFSAFLLLMYLEQQLLERRVNSVQSVVRLFSEQLFFSFDTDGFYPQLQSGLKNLQSFSNLENFSMINNQGDLYFSSPAANELWPDLKKMRKGLSSQKSLIEVRYQSGLLAFFSSNKEDFILITQPLSGQGSIKGCLQGRFSLVDIRNSMIHAQKIILIFLALYGLILVLFGSYLLNKTIVKPIIELRRLARGISDGQLAKPVNITGPKEISELSTDLDDMRRSLLENRRQTQIHISELKTLNEKLTATQNELIQAAKMSSIGQLASGMAHEIGNPLGALTGYLDLLNHEVLSEMGRDVVAAAQNETGRIDQLIRDLLDYARPDNGHNSETNCLEVIESTVRNLVHQGAISSEQLKFERPSSPVKVKIAANRLQQVLVNLLMNARDASMEGSLIQLKIKQEAAVVIAVINQGVPIPPSQLSVLFDPFFTTKDQNKGRGLGLFVCHNIIHNADGKIDVISNEKETIFSITLPAAEAMA